MTIYLDVIFLENLAMNYIILLATGLINHIKLKQIKCLLASIIGSIYAVISMMGLSVIYANLFLKIALSIAMIYIAFSPKSPKVLLKQLIIFYLTSFAFGGCSFALLYFIKPENIKMQDGVLMGSYPIKIALLGGIVGFVVIINAFKIMKGKFSKKDMFCEIEIVLEGKKRRIKTMIDTGNMLKDPITRFPVAVVEKEELRNLIPDSILEHAQEMATGTNEKVWEEMKQQDYLARFRMIPFSSIGKEHGILLGIKADGMKIFQEEEEYLLRNVIIGIYENRLSKNGSYGALIGMEMLGREEIKYEYSGNSKV